MKRVNINLLKETRNKRGLSQLSLAKLTNIAPGDISRIENGWIHPYPGWRKRLAEALGVSERELFPENTTLPAKGGSPRRFSLKGSPRRDKMRNIGRRQCKHCGKRVRGRGAVCPKCGKNVDKGG